MPLPTGGGSSTGKGSFVRNKLAKKGQTTQTKKAHNYDARTYHQNVHQTGIRALTVFQCPVCGCKNTVRVTLNKKDHTAEVKCSYCLSLKPRPEDLPYPSLVRFLPKEVMADVFFRFDREYRDLLEKQGAETVATAVSREFNDARNGRIASAGSGLIGHLLDGAPASDGEEEGDTDATSPQRAEAEGETKHSADEQPQKLPEVSKLSTEDVVKDTDMVSDVEDFFNDSD